MTWDRLYCLCLVKRQSRAGVSGSAGLCHGDNFRKVRLADEIHHLNGSAKMLHCRLSNIFDYRSPALGPQNSSPVIYTFLGQSQE